MADSKADSGSLLINAVRAGNLDSVKKLIHAHGLRCCEGGHRDYFLLFLAVTLGCTEIAKFLLQEGARFDCEADGVAKTLMHFAAEQRDEELIRALVWKNAPIDAVNEFNQTALHFAAHKGYKKTVEVLLDNEASVNVLCKSGYTPLQLAVFEKHEGVIDVIEGHFKSLLAGSFVLTDEENESDEEDNVRANKNGIKEHDIYKDDVNKGAVKKDDVHDDDINKLVSHIVMHENYVKEHSLNDIIGNLLARGFLLNSKYVTESFLLSAIENEYTSVIKQFLKIGRPYDVKYNVLLLRIAIRKNEREIINQFLNSNATKGNSPILEEDDSISKEDKWIEVIKLLISKGVEIDKAPELLHLAIEDALVKVCELLIANGANVNAATTYGETPLHLCPKQWKKEMMKKNEIIALLLRSGAFISSKDKYGLTAFHQAVVKELEGAVHVFLNSGVDVNLLAEDGSTPLHLAAKSDRRQIAKILCENKANVSARREDGLTPLHLAESRYMVETLLQYGADIGAKGIENQTALHCAVLRTRNEQTKEVVTALIENGVDISGETNGNTAIDLIYLDAKLKNTWDYHLNRRARKIVDILKRQAIKLEAAGLYVHEVHFELFEDSFKKEVPAFSRECKKEVKRLKNEKLSQRFTVHDILTMRKNPTYARNESLIQSLKSFKFGQFPIYESLLKNTLQSSQSRLELVSSGRKWLGILVKAGRKMNGMEDRVLPDEMLEEIVSYLNNSELKSFISCGEALKDKLKH